MISLIVAKSKNNVIGIKNTIPWHLSEDLKRFKKLTVQTNVIMGRKTFESIGKALPNRINIVISKTIDKSKIKDVIVVDSLESALLKCQNDKDIFVIGGGQIYAESLNKNIIDKIYITEILEEYDGDAMFPELNSNLFQLSEESEILKCKNSNLEYQYKTYIKSIPL